MVVFIKGKGKRIVALRKRQAAARRRNLGRMMVGRPKQNFLRVKRTWRKSPQGEGLPGGTWDLYWDSATSAFVNCNGVGHEFKLSDLPNSAEFTALFDAYRIRGVKLEFVPVYNSHEINEGPAATPFDRLGLPLMTYARDYDDATSPANENTLLQYAANHRINLTNKKSIYIRNPRVATTVYQSGLTAAYSEAKKNVWIDCANPDVPHYGLKYFVPTENLSKILYVRVYATYYLEFKRVI